jgi:hypothetical protein
VTHRQHSRNKESQQLFADAVQELRQCHDPDSLRMRNVPVENTISSKTAEPGPAEYKVLAVKTWRGSETHAMMGYLLLRGAADLLMLDADCEKLTPSAYDPSDAIPCSEWIDPIPRFASKWIVLVCK